MKTITNDEVLFTCTFKSDRTVKLSLWKQSYSDGTCFYTLQDAYKNWKVHHGSRDLKELTEQMKHELNIHNEYTENEYIMDNEVTHEIYKNYAIYLQDVIQNLEDVSLEQ